MRPKRACALAQHDPSTRYADLVEHIHREPLAMLFSRMAGWLSAVLLSSARRPDLVQTLTFVPAERRWRLSIIVDGETVFEGLSSHMGQLAIDAERDFRAWADDCDRKENEARLEASVTDMQKE